MASDQQQVIILESTTSSDEFIVKLSDGCVFAFSTAMTAQSRRVVQIGYGTGATALFDTIVAATEKLSTSKGSTIEITIPDDDKTLSLVLDCLFGQPSLRNSEEVMEKKFRYLAGKIPFDMEKEEGAKCKVAVAAKKAWDSFVRLFCINSLIRNQKLS